MNHHTQTAREWLDRRFQRDSGGGYKAHQPISGLRTERAEPNAILRYARTYRLLELLHSLEFESVLDVGGGEGYLAALIRDLFGVKAVHSSDLSVEACQRAREIFGIDGAAADSNRLPFADKSYDLVICSEVIEHLSRPVAAISELARIARKFVVISTAEFCPAGELERTLRSYTLDRSYPHSEVNWFTSGDFASLLGEGVSMSAQFRNLAHLLPELPADQEHVERALTFLTGSNDVDVDHAGVVVISGRNGATVPAAPARLPGQRRRQVLNRLLDPPPLEGMGTTAGAEVDESVLARLQCPHCKGAVAPKAVNSLACTKCDRGYEVRGGIPTMFIDPSDEPSEREMEDECVKTLSGGKKTREAAIRQVIGRLHGNEQRDNPAWKQNRAQQLLRVLWLLARNEGLGSKARRLFGRMAGKPPVGYEELQAALSAPAQGDTADLAQRRSMSRA
jgi:ubiquinone/menaquinone biosynthesis C-methylase UbiE/uncharacterized protein YbaR (Trm112 family)